LIDTHVGEPTDQMNDAGDINGTLEWATKSGGY
jgi:hypothetical protein